MLTQRLVWLPKLGTVMADFELLSAFDVNAISTEDSSNTGRLDMAVRFNGHTCLFEFKVVEIEPEGRALAQIKNKGYANQYLGDGQPITLIGVKFSKASRSVVDIEVETLLHQ